MYAKALRCGLSEVVPTGCARATPVSSTLRAEPSVSSLSHSCGYKPCWRTSLNPVRSEPYPGPRTYYLPASRSGLVESHGTLVGSSLERLTHGSGRQQQATLSGVLVDFITQTFVDVGSHFSEWKRGELLARLVEQTITDGTVRVHMFENGASSIAYRPAGWKEDLPLTRASSMVTEIIPLVLYLRHYVTRGATIVIEEPEAHMHPAMQVRMAAAIAEIVNAGVRVIITTHSEWILSALANVVRSAELPKSEQKDIAGHGVALPASKVGCWRFVPEADRGSVTRELRLDSEDGMFGAGYPEVGQGLYKRLGDDHQPPAGGLKAAGLDRAHTVRPVQQPQGPLDGSNRTQRRNHQGEGFGWDPRAASDWSGYRKRPASG